MRPLVLVAVAVVQAAEPVVVEPEAAVLAPVEVLAVGLVAAEAVPKAGRLQVAANRRPLAAVVVVPPVAALVAAVLVVAANLPPGLAVGLPAVQVVVGNRLPVEPLAVAVGNHRQPVPAEVLHPRLEQLHRHQVQEYP